MAAGLRERRLQISLVPRPLQRNNLRSAIGQYRWQKHRRSILPKKLTCSTCNAKVKEPSQLHAHEEWAYMKRGKINIAKLTGISFQCPLCHGCHHIVLSFILLGPERIHETIDHYCKVNRVSEATFHRDLTQAMAIWKKRSKLKWVIDYGLFSSLIAEREAWKNRARAKLRLDPAKDSEPTPRMPWPRRGRPPIFGRPMTPSEHRARYRYFKRMRRDQD